MSLFFDYRVDGPRNVDPLLVAWSQTQPTLAVAYSDHSVLFFQEEAEVMEDERISREVNVSAMAWQPNGKLLAVGWEDGSVTMWNSQDKSIRDSNSIHKTPLKFVEWSATGNRFVTGDMDGVFCIWRAEARGFCSPIAQYRKKGTITHCAFLTQPNSRSKSTGLTSKMSTPTRFFVGGEQGIVCLADDMKNCQDVQMLKTAIEAMLYYEAKRRLVILTRSLLMIQLQVSDDGSISTAMKVKLSITGDPGGMSSLWVGPGLMATASVGEKIIRFWDLAGDENYVLSLSTAGSSIAHNDRVNCIDFNPRKRALAAGTRNGKVVVWQFHGFGGSDLNATHGGTTAANWEALLPISVSGPVNALMWGPGEHILAAAMPQGASILNETVLHRKMFDDIAAVQQSADRIAIEVPNAAPRLLEANIRVKGLALDDRHVVVWNGKKVEIYDHTSPNVRMVQSFSSQTEAIVIRGDNLYRAVDSHVEVCSFGGSVKSTISFTETEGVPELLDLNGRYLAVGTSNGRIKIFDVDRREPKPCGSGGQFEDAETGKSIGRMKSIRVNADGNRVSVLADLVTGGSLQMSQPDTRLHVYNADMDVVPHYEFGPGRVPISHAWDPTEPKLMACETMRTKQGASKAEKTNTKSQSKFDSSTGASNFEESSIEVTTLFVTSDYGILMQDSFQLESSFEALMGLKVPRLYFMAKFTEEMQKNHKSSGGMIPRLKSRVMRDFVGLETVDDVTRAALMDFSYYLTVGNMDEAYRAVKLIKSPSVWENMAHMCVKTKRLDVAEVCLGNMGHARGARAVREAKKEPELEACIAMVAIQLGLLDDAVSLYKECGRYDLLNQLYQAAGQWDRALEIAHSKDRIHLRTTHYNFAKHLESLGDTASAIKNYEKSDTHRKEVPRLLFDANYVDDLESYINQVADKDLLKWWAQYCESNGYFEKASSFYHRAEDHLSLVRVACYNRDFQKAADIVRDTQSEAAAYHLARQHEGTGNIQEAINYFSRAGRYNHAIRLSKEHGLDTELMSFALQSTTSQMVDCAEYFEQKGEYEKAVQLFQKGGNIPKALDLCFRAQLFDVLHTIADDLGSETDPETLAKCAKFFLDHGQYEKAVHLYITAKRFNEALDMCLQHKIKITDEMAQKMTLPKSDDADKNAERLALLEKLAKCCKKQGSYHLATQKYTQAGDKLKAMKCLLKSGDTEKVIFFADVSRNAKIYIIAANYLQNLDWHNDPEIMKAIIKFYTKAKAFEQLSGFYDACAQVEIDEYRDYEKALGALKEAVKYMIKSSKAANKEEQMASLHQRIGLVEMFVQARRLVKTDPAEMVKMVHQLLERPDVETAIRVGDGFALLIEFHYAGHNFEQAYRLIEKMRERHIILNPYLDQDMINTIYSRVGVAVEAEDKDEMEEDIADDVVEEEVAGEDSGQFRGK